MKLKKNNNKQGGKIAVLKVEPKSVKLPGWKQPAHKVLLAMAKFGGEVLASGQTAEQAVMATESAANIKRGDAEYAAKVAGIEAAIRLARTFNKLKSDPNHSVEAYIKKVNSFVKAGNTNLIIRMNVVVMLYGEPSDQTAAREYLEQVADDKAV